MEIKQFDFSNMNILVDRVLDIWTPPKADEVFKRIYAEAVIRQDMHNNQMQFQITENNELRAIACASVKNEQNNASDWWNEQYKNLNPEQQFAFKLSKDYLNLMDKKTYDFMDENDIKLDLFISAKKGWGKKILEHAINSFKQASFRNLYLWTDSDCNVDWYISHNYELVKQDIYEPFSTENEEYKTFIFKKKLY